MKESERNKEEVRFSFREFLPGELRSPVKPTKEAAITYQTVRCRLPARFGTLLINPSRFAHPKRPYFYDVSNVNFAVGVYTQAEITLIDNDNIVVDPSVERPLIAKHAAELIRKAAGMTNIGLKIKTESNFRITHAGLATSAAIQHSVAYAVNKAFGEPLSKEQLITYLAENNGEESSNQGYLVSEPSTGGLGAVCLFGGGVVFVGDEMKVVARTKVPQYFTYVLGIPLAERKGKVEEIEDNYTKVVVHHEKVDKEWGAIKKAIVEKELIPAFQRDDIETIGQIVFDYTLNRFGDVQTSFDLTCPGIPMSEYLRSLEKLRKNKSIISAFVSSTGPGIVILTTNPEIAKNHLKSLGIQDIFYFHPDNVGAIFECH